MPSPIQYPNYAGQRHSPASAELKIQIGSGNPFVFAAWQKIDYSWEVKPEEVRGNHPDPVGLTLGTATYEASWDVLLAEYNYLLASMGKGFAAIPINFTIAYSETGFDTIVDQILGVRLTKGAGTMSNDAKGLVRSIDLKPLKILPNGVDMLLIPLQGSPT